MPSISLSILDGPSHSRFRFLSALVHSDYNSLRCKGLASFQGADRSMLARTCREFLVCSLPAKKQYARRGQKESTRLRFGAIV